MNIKLAMSAKDTARFNDTRMRRNQLKDSYLTQIASLALDTTSPKTPALHAAKRGLTVATSPTGDRPMTTAQAR